MPGTNGTDPIAAAADLLADRLEKIRAELAAFDALRDEQRRVTSALRALAPDHELVQAVAKPGPKPNGTRKRAGYGAARNMRPESLELIWAWVRERGDETFTAPDVIDALAEVEGAPTHEPIRRGLKMLRDGQAIRLAGKGGKSGSANVFRLLDVGAGDAVLARNAEAFAEH